MKQLRPYQQYASERASRQSLLIGDQCGLGKTLEAIEALKRIQTDCAKPALIVVPSGNVKLQWYAELQGQGICQDRIFWLDSNNPDILNNLATDSIILTHYEALRKWVAAKLYLLIGTHYSVIIADEAHRIKNRKAQRTVALKQLKAYRKIALTGTPYDRNVADCWSILNWLDPYFYSSYWAFFNAHVDYREIALRSGQTVKTPIGIKNPASFARMLRRDMIQRTKSEVRSDMPERIDQYIDLEMTRDQAIAYRKLRAAEDPIVEIDGNEISVGIILTQILRAIQMTTDPTLLGIKASSIKLDWVHDWLEDNPHESIIIFTRFRDTAKLLATTLGERFKLVIGGNCATIGSEDRYLVGTIAAMGEGLDLPHIDHAIFIDVEWDSILMQQAIDRIHRINITNAKHIYYLRCVNTLDTLVHQAIQNKWSTKELVTNYLQGVLA